MELTKQYELHPNQTTEWKRQLVERAAEVFSGSTASPPVDLKPLHAKSGQQALEIDFLAGALDKAGLWKRWGESAIRDLMYSKLAVELSGGAALLAIALTTPTIFTAITGNAFNHDRFHNQFILYGVGWGVVLFAAINGAGYLKAVFSVSVMRYFGFIGISLYLFHVIALRAITACCTSMPFSGVLALISSLLVTHAT